MKKTLLTLLTAGYMLFNSLSAKAQTVSGQITDLFNTQPIDSALVQIENFGQDYTENGFYSITSSGVSPYIIIPNNTPKKLEIVNILGQRILDKDISLDDIIGNKLRIDNLQNVASGVYPFRVLDKNNQIYASGLIPIIEGSNVSLVPFSIVNNQNSNSGRKINDLDSYLEVRINHPNFWERVTYIDEPTGNVEFNEGLISGDSTFLSFVDDVCMRTQDYGSSRCVQDIPFYIYPHFIQNGNNIPQSEIDKVIDVITNYLPQVTLNTITGQYIITDTLPSSQIEGIFRVYWDSSLPFVGAVSNTTNSNHEVIKGNIRFKYVNIPFSVFLQELTQVTGPIQNSNIITPSIFSDTGAYEYQNCDINLMNSLYKRQPNWKSPDTNSF